MKFSLAIVLAVFSTSAYADDCDVARSELNTFDAVYCQNKVFIAEDVRLNENYGILRGLLSANGRNALRTGQRNWIEYRNDECTGTSERWGEVVYARCAKETTRERADFLGNRITECETVGCQISKLSDLR
ncbi:lysozyme inhibitor LprI family protein [Halocynthiibacter namhaensis]|uniref:lysozyme inhibitor LprI family protein n=1 Tax=Halocynthiibacter namhaensis TaxID=1290553 RepID=UPI00057989A4|nr:lysozyme inhibitor LprI family protein [Halocynthiibacter namhaensis]